ncbi:MAG: hypothetical protein BWY70_00237 [Bacteroidetes bacterium ADurb.Bin408]|nr:MAG: hypothetical protein BWY70_00237 [Bacteroidetes bacterium ADurb.Bin408]
MRLSWPDGMTTPCCVSTVAAFGVTPTRALPSKTVIFSVEHYGGSAWRWTCIITYKYSKQEKEWLLHKDGAENLYIYEPEKVERNIKTTKVFGKVKFEAFDIYKEE